VLGHHFYGPRLHDHCRQGRKVLADTSSIAYSSNGHWREECHNRLPTFRSVRSNRSGFRHIFGLIGDSLNPLADAVRRSKIEWIGVRHEEGAALAASGQAKFTGRLGVCAGTTGPGSTHLVAGLYEATRDHAPVLALSGEMPRKLQGTEYIQTTAPDLLFRDVSLYTETISAPAQAPGVIHQAIVTAYAGPALRI